MPTIELHQVDSFTDTLFGGNPAGVVTDASALSDREMASIAREMNVSETAFVLPATSAGADLRLRFFTPTTEVRFCGHATVGALYQLAFGGTLELGEVRVETGVGVIEMAVASEDGALRVSFTAPPVELVDYRLQGSALADELGIPAELLNGRVHLDPGLRNLFIPIRSLSELAELSFDFARIRERFGAEGIVIFALFSKDAFDPQHDLHVRGLAPNVGVDEDPVTGSMQAGLVLAAKANGFLAPDQADVVTEQGHIIQRPGFVAVHHDLESDELRVTAHAVHVFSTTLTL